MRPGKSSTNCRNRARSCGSACPPPNETPVSLDPGRPSPRSIRNANRAPVDPQPVLGTTEFQRLACKKICHLIPRTSRRGHGRARCAAHSRFSSDSLASSRPCGGSDYRRERIQLSSGFLNRPSPPIRKVSLDSVSLDFSMVAEATLRTYGPRNVTCTGWRGSVPDRIHWIRHRSDRISGCVISRNTKPRVAMTT